MTTALRRAMVVELKAKPVIASAPCPRECALTQCECMCDPICTECPCVSLCVSACVCERECIRERECVCV
eukprot:3537094-Rhodomonas_salina.1